MMRWVRWLLLACVLPALWAAGACAALFDASELMVVFRDDRSATDLFAGCLMAGTVLVAILLWTWRIRRMETDRAVFRACYMLLAAVLVVKLGWCFWLDSAQPNDMGRYWHYGKLLAQDNKPALLADVMFTKDIFVRRSFFYTGVIFRALGTGATQLELANVGLQMATLVLLLLWGRSALGIRAIASALPWFVVYPDWWFAPTLASHDIPGMFFISVVLWSAERVRVQLTGVLSGAAVPWGSLLTCAAIAGIGSAFLNVTRDFGPFAILASAFAAGMSLIFAGYPDADPRAGRRRLPAALLIISCLVLMVIVYTSANRKLLQLSEVPGITNRGFDLLQLFSGVNSDSDAAFSTIAPWAFEYFPALPADEKDEVLKRKLLWEKSGKGVRFWSHLARKKAVIAYSGKTMEYAFCGVNGDKVGLWDINHLSRYRIFCGIVYGTLALVFFIRLLLVDRVGIGPGEAAVLILGFTFLVPLLLLTEAQNAYDQVLAIPLGTAAGVLAVGSWSAKSKQVTQAGRDRLLAGGCSLLLLGFSQLAAGRVVNSSGMTFATVSDVVSQSGRAESSDTRVALDFTESQYHGTGEMILAEAKFRLSGSSLSDGKICCFLSGDHESQTHFYPLDWGTCPYRWEIWLAGSRVASGDLLELSSPKFLKLQMPEAGLESVTCRLVIKGSEAWTEKISLPSWNQSQAKTRIAMEYCY